MATEVLRPQDCLTGRIRSSPALFPRRKGCNYGNSYSNSRSTPSPSPNHRPIQKQHSTPRSEKSDHKRRSPQPEPRRSGSDGRTGLVMEKVTILRRGSSLDSKIRSAVSPKKDVADPAAKQVHCSSMMMMMKSDMYAGSAFALSPEPSSLPLPSFSKKKAVSFNDSATKDLRRLLQLN